MSHLESALHNIITQATQDYKDIATNDPVVQSSDDNTAKGDHLDRILRAQQLEKKELWDKLYQLENSRIQDQANAVFNSKSEAVTSTARKQLQALMYEHREINNLVASEMANLDTLEQPSDDILEIEFREDVDRQIKQYASLNQFAKRQLDHLTSTLREEKKVLSECEDVYAALKEKERELAQEAYVQSYPDQLRREQAEWDSQYKQDTHDLIDFLDEFYPPHAVDNAGVMGEQCELKELLEELMNQAVDSPDNPYIKLVPGTYWSPYIQTLVKGGVVKYHPTDSSFIRVNDFTY
ncbi:uncharacterized protein ATC70_002934 [Mucor velutinosus]|uniref:Uncharacterized protein n=1 Tax=Mucor velutinosus TaxID=708070 RepID=A0AAN7D7H2_9FUNG|nr:hypothetical protein ATC70_002934 [Mucor velutinosus]